jgi:hypothetical protein
MSFRQPLRLGCEYHHISLRGKGAGSDKQSFVGSPLESASEVTNLLGANAAMWLELGAQPELTLS